MIDLIGSWKFPNPDTASAAISQAKEHFFHQDEEENHGAKVLLEISLLWFA